MRSPFPPLLPWSSLLRPALAACLLIASSAAQGGTRDPRLSDEALPPQVDAIPARPRPLLELGDPFFGPGPIGEGFELPTGAVAQPSFLVFGSLRTALQATDPGAAETSELVTRLDLFGNLQLGGTERILVGLRPLDDDGSFTRYVFDAPDPDDEGWHGETDAELSALFFEGELGEILPGLDRGDRRALDLGIAVGRQPLLFQDGLLIDDTIDSIGVTRNALRPPGFSNLRVTALVGWNEVNRDDNVETDATLVGLFSEGDVGDHTVSLDTVYVDDDGDTDGFYVGAGSVQRWGRTNTALRVLSSFASGPETPAVGEGALLLAELSRTPGLSDDLVYLNAFVGFDRPSYAARGPGSGGPLGRLGLSFGAVGMGSYGAPLGNRPEDAVGAALGWQHVLDEARRHQVVLELGGRASTEDSDERAVASTLRWERALGRHAILRADGFLTARHEERGQAGARLELLLRF